MSKSNSVVLDDKQIYEIKKLVNGLLGSLKIVDCIFEQAIKAEKGEESSFVPFKDKLSLLEYFKVMNQINLDYLRGILGDE